MWFSTFFLKQTLNFYVAADRRAPKQRSTRKDRHKHHYFQKAVSIDGFQSRDKSGGKYPSSVQDNVWHQSGVGGWLNLNPDVEYEVNCFHDQTEAIKGNWCAFVQLDAPSCNPVQP
jgi:hypothetical protein